MNNVAELSTLGRSLYTCTANKTGKLMDTIYQDDPSPVVKLIIYQFNQTAYTNILTVVSKSNPLIKYVHDDFLCIAFSWSAFLFTFS